MGREDVFFALYGKLRTDGHALGANPFVSV